jgi:hypothetical protein
LAQVPDGFIDGDDALARGDHGTGGFGELFDAHGRLAVAVFDLVPVQVAALGHVHLHLLQEGGQVFDLAFATQGGRIDGLQAGKGHRRHRVHRGGLADLGPRGELPLLEGRDGGLRKRVPVALDRLAFAAAAGPGLQQREVAGAAIRLDPVAHGHAHVIARLRERTRIAGRGQLGARRERPVAADAAFVDDPHPVLRLRAGASRKCQRDQNSLLHRHIVRSSLTRTRNS